jgi:RNA polymerase sigma factor (sigma-70 family)
MTDWFYNDSLSSKNTMAPDAMQEELREALAGNVAALNRLIHKLTPVIQSRVVRVLLRWSTGIAARRDVRQEVEDFTQEILLKLFADDAKVLRTWQPERGLSLINFVGLVAERQTVSILRNGKRSPWKEDPTLPEDFPPGPPESDSEEIAVSREQLRLVLDRLKEELSPLGWHLFDLVYLQDLSVEEVARQTAMSSDAVYAWRSRLRRLARRLLEEQSENMAVRRTSVKGGNA